MRWCSMHPRSPIFFSFGEEGWGVIEFSGFWFSECVCIKFRMCFHDVPQGTLILKMFPTTQHLHIACAMLSTPHWHIPNSTLPNSQLHVIKLPTSHWEHYIVNLPNLHVHFEVHTWTLPTFQVYMWTMSSSHLHIVKFPSLQDDRCTL